MTPPFAHWSPSPQFSWGMATFGAFCGPARRRRAQGGLWIAISHHVNKRGGWYMGNEKCQHSCVDRQ